MIDREHVVTLLRHRFPDATPKQIAEAVNGIVGLGDDWVELTGLDRELDAHLGTPCGNSCALAKAGRRFRVFTRRTERDSRSP